MLRFVVVLASAVQITLSAFVAWRLIGQHPLDIIAIVLCTAVMLAGLAGLSALHARTRPSVSRQATVKLNGLLLGLVGVAAAILITIEHREGVLPERLQLLMWMFAGAGSPFLANAMALTLIERRSRRAERLVSG